MANHFPEYESGRLYAKGDKVYLERFCTCGGILRVRGPIEDVLPFRERWDAGHGNREGHEPTDKLTAVIAREDLKRSVQEAADDIEYESTDWNKKRIAVTNEEVYQ